MKVLYGTDRGGKRKRRKEMGGEKKRSEVRVALPLNLGGQLTSFAAESNICEA